MTKIKFYKNSDMWTRVECAGHSGFAEAGLDIVCASVSTAMQSTILGLIKVVGIKDLKYTIDNKKAYLYFELPASTSNNASHDAQVLINTLYVTISDLQQGYSKHITMEVVK